MGRRMHINVNRLCVLILLGAIAYNEFFAYYLSYSSWASIPPQSCSLLFLADPQLQGYNGEPPGLLGTIQRWDSDRYLKIVYSWMSYKYPFSTPVFLGKFWYEHSYRSRSEIQNRFPGSIILCCGAMSTKLFSEVKTIDQFYFYLNFNFLFSDSRGSCLFYF